MICIRSNGLHNARSTTNAVTNEICALYRGVTNVPFKRTSFTDRLLSKSSWANIIHGSQSDSIVAADTDNCSSLYHLSNRSSFVVRAVCSQSSNAVSPSRSKPAVASRDARKQTISLSSATS